MDNFKANELLTKFADATWRCGDPGMQFDTTVNRWHTSKNTAADQRLAILAPSTCSSTTPPATWPA